MKNTSRFPLISHLALESRSAISPNRTLSAEQREAQAELRSKFGNDHVPEGAVILPWYTEKPSGERRDLSASLGTSSQYGGALVPTEVPEVGTALRSAFVMERLGARVYGGLMGDANFPKARPEVVAEWLSETAAATESTFSFSSLELSPKRVTAFLDVSIRLLKQGEAVEAYLRAELFAVLASEIQRVLINGSGSNNQPRGILNTSGIGSVAGGTNGAAPDLQDLVDLEHAVTGTGKADSGRTGWIISPKVRRRLRTTFANGTGSAPLFSLSESDRLLGHPAAVINSSPDTLTKGSASGVCSAITFLDFTEVIVGFWGAGIVVDVVRDASQSKVGHVTVVASAYTDGGLRAPTAAAAMLDALC